MTDKEIKRGILKGRTSYIVTFLAGAFFVLVIVLALRGTDTLEFCVSCHTMKHPYEEFKNSGHYKNTFGVRLGCPDCHVPHDSMDLIKAKIIASKDIFFEIVRPAKTKEEFEQIRPKLAKRVREKFLANDSAPCRRCHAYDNFQRPTPIKAHARAVEQKITCIACHYNLVHAEVPWPEMEQEE